MKAGMEDMQDWCAVCGDTRLFTPVVDSDSPGEADYACVDCGAAVLVPAGAIGHAAVA